VRASLAAAGWALTDARELDRPGAYRRFIRTSQGEISVAKDQYVLPRSGWISDRTVCYLASGRPSIVQRTGVSDVPIGSGLVDFSTLEEAGSAISAVTSDYERHAAAAMELAGEYFEAEKVLTSLLGQAGLW
jgi:hypothetical protein